MSGCSVFTRPSIISGNPVTSETLVTVSPAAVSVFAVPPVETSSKPRAARPRPSSTMPILSETLRSALRIFYPIRYVQPVDDVCRVQYYLFGRRAGLAPKGKGRTLLRPFFLPFQSAWGEMPRKAEAECPGINPGLNAPGSITTRDRVTERRKKNDAHHRQGQVVQQRQGVRFHRA